MRILFTCILSLLLSQALWAQNESVMRASPSSYKHRVAFTPIAGIFAYGYGNPGMGFDYEYVFDTEHGIGVHIPFAFGFPIEDDYYNGYRHNCTYVAPGLLFHTSSRRARIDFATGPSILLGNLHFGPSKDYVGPYPGDPYNYSMFGFLVDNTINFSREHFQFGFDVRMGSLLDQHDDNRFFIHFGMHFGGRF